MPRYSSGILTRSEIKGYLDRPTGDGLFISPLLDEGQINDTSIDLRLGHRFLVPDSTRVDTLDVFDHDWEQESVEGSHYREILVHYGKGFNFHPGQSVLIGTLEYIGMPEDLEGYVFLRSSLSRLPILANTATIHPGFRGVITLPFTSMAASPVVLRPGQRVAQLQLHYLAEKISREKESRYDMAIGPASTLLNRDSDIRYLGPSVEPIIIGLVSTLGAGRTTAVKYLQERHGFAVFSLSDIIKAEANKRSTPISRAALQDLGSHLREYHGNDYLAAELRASRVWKMNTNPYVVADGFKHPDEVREFRKQRRFYLLAIEAPFEVRWERTNKLRRTGDPLTREEFQKLDAIDRGLTEAVYGQRVDAVLSHADFHVLNDGTPKELYSELERIVNQILS